MEGNEYDCRYDIFVPKSFGGRWHTQLLIDTKKPFLLSLFPFPEPNTDTELVLREATVKIHAKYDIFETTLQIEVFGEDMENCEACVNPT